MSGSETKAAGWPHETSPYHRGERMLQARAGVRERAERAGRRMIRNFMPEQHRELFENLPYLVAGSLDAEGRPWASILVGRPGFVRAPDAVTLEIDARPGFGDPLAANLAPGAPVGLLGIELETRRRNRANGRIVSLAPRIAVRVAQSFGNCPQYIQARTPAFLAEPESMQAPRPIHAEGPRLSPAAAALILRADTFFIATATPAARESDAPAEGVDVSHRGGNPGFVRVGDEGGATLLTVPDFSGNSSFNTLGNIALEPRAGLLFVDFASGDLLSLTGAAEVVWDGPEVAAFAGALRLLRVRVAAGLRIERAVPFAWSAAEPAPQLARTGSWDEAAARLALAAGG
jgi:predicted pyridoxine 5'-phosphate oxidase superfamily flavin-nucleotide-binding protein